jgi:hypothetical protein
MENKKDIESTLEDLMFIYYKVVECSKGATSNSLKRDIFHNLSLHIDDIKDQLIECLEDI